MPQKSNNPWDPNRSAGSPIPQDKDDELEMAEDDEDMDDEDFDEDDDADETEGVEEDSLNHPAQSSNLQSPIFNS